MRKLVYRLNSISLRTRLMSVFALLIIVPLIIQGFISLSILSGSVLDRYQSEMDYRFSQMEDRVDELFEECYGVLFDVAYEKEIQKILKSEYEDENLIQSRYIVEELLLDSRMSYSGIQYSILVYDLEGNCYTNDYLNLFSYKDLLLSKTILDTHINSNIMLSEMMEEQNFRNIIMARPIFNEEGRERIGTVVVRIDSGHIMQIFEDVFRDSGANVSVIDANGTVVASDIHLSGSQLEMQGVLKLDPYSSDAVEYNNKILFSSEKDSRGWTYVAQIESGTMNHARQEMQMTTYLMVCMVLILSALVLIYISVDVVSPIKRLTESLEAVDGADTAELTFKPKYNDEIGRMARSYNNMTYKLKASVEKIKKIENQKQRAEIKMLEAQISPHFLYNTLSSVIWLVHKDKKTEAIEMMESLARLYQISLSRGREIISLRQEFDHAESYLRIQEERYRGNFDYELTLEDEIADLSVVKVVLQPLIENAIYHGVRKMGRDGKIIVRGSLRGKDRVLLQVMDNGNMLGEEGCRKMNLALEENTESVLGIGVSNVMARLRLYYKDNCSMHYTARDGFTVVEIELQIGEMNKDV